MFAKLKKKIEEEVGDLGQLTSPLSNPFGSGDRRVGGSTQGTNTPNNLGSRQSSLASLVDLHPHDEPTSPTPGMPTANHLAVPLTPVPASLPRSANAATAAASTPRQKSQELEAEMKKVNSEWAKKFDSMKKSFEERLQNQEADFAWKYSSKDEELEKIRAEKRKADELIRTMEGSYHNKMTRVQDDMDQLEGLTKQEMAKVKHLLLNTQAELQKAQSDLIEQGNIVKELSEENRQLKSENDTILRNLDRDRLNRVKFEAEHGDTIAQISNLQLEIQQREESMSDFRCSSEESTKQLLKIQADLQKAQSDLVDQGNISKELSEENKQLKSKNESILKNLETEHGDTVAQTRKLQSEIQLLEASLSELRITLEESSNQVVRTQADLQTTQSHLTEQQNISKELSEENKKLKVERDDVLRNLDRDRQDRVQIQAQHLESVAQVRTLQLEIEQREVSLAELRSSYEESTNQLQKIQAELQKTQSDLVDQGNISKEVSEENKQLKSKNESILRNLETEHGDTVAQIRKLQSETQILESSLSELRITSEVSSKQLVRTQADLQKTQSNLTEQQNISKELSEENKKLKVEHDDVLRNLDRDRQDRVQIIQAQLVESVAQVRTLQLEIEQREVSLAELRSSYEESTNQLLKVQAELQKTQSDLADQGNISKKLSEENKQLQSKNESILKNLETEHGDTASQIRKLQNDTQLLESSLSELRISLEESSKQLVRTQADLQRTQSDLTEQQNISKELSEENKKLKVEHDDVLRNLDRDRQDRVQIQAQVVESVAQVRTLQLEIEQREVSLAELRSSYEESTNQLQKVQAELQKAQSVLVEQENIAKELLEENKQFKSEKDSILQNLDHDKENRVQLGMEHSSQINSLKNEIQELEETRIELQSSLEESSKELQVTLEELGKSFSDLKSAKLYSQQLESQYHEATSKIVQLEIQLQQREVADRQVAENGKDEDEDVESYKERIRELETKLSDKNKALKLRQQQLQDLRKTLAKEMKGNSSSAQLQPSEPSELFSKSPSQNSLNSSGNDIRVEEISQTDTEPAVIPSSNSHLDASRTYAEDVNFQYLKTVVFKFVTSPDPQVTQHLTKVVSTLLHLSDEESRILEKCTDKRLLTWLGSREHQPY